MRTIEDLRMMQALPLKAKVLMTQQRIREWVREYGTDGIYISFSGGKDSTVLLHLVRGLYPDIEAVFVNTGLEYPEIQKFVMTFDNVTILRPKMRFDEVIKKFGYPVISKEVASAIHYEKKGSIWAKNYFNGLDGKGNPSEFKKSMYAKYKPITEMDFNVSDKCCYNMKENPIDNYAKTVRKKPIIAIMASESKKRETAWLKTGCNAFDGKRPVSKPMSFWTEQDVLQYIKENNISIAPVYGDIVRVDDYYQDTGGTYCERINFSDMGLMEDCGEKLMTTGCDRTGCIFCAFGCHLEKRESRFQRLKKTHPRQYEYCIGGGEYDEAGIWQPSKDGLGMGHVFDELNRIYGDGFIRY